MKRWEIYVKNLIFGLYGEIVVVVESSKYFIF